MRPAEQAALRRHLDSSVTPLPGAMALPHEPAAEQALVGAIIADPTALDAAGDLMGEHFHEAAYGRVYDAAAADVRTHGRASLIVLARRFADDSGLIALGGEDHLQELMASAPAARSVAGIAEMVIDHAQRRALMQLGQQSVVRASDTSDGTADTLLADVERQVGQIAQKGASREAWIDGGEVIERAIAMAQARNGEMDAISGLADLDDFTGGFARGEVTIIAGRPGMAKSLGASQIAKANAARGLGTVFFSQEMAEEQLGLRLACDLAFDREAATYGGGVENPKFFDARKNALTPQHWAKLREAAAIVRQWPLAFDVRPALTVSQMERAALRRFRRWEAQGIKRGPVVIDHMGLIRAEMDRKGNRHQEVADVSRALAIMAKRLDVPVICLCQLNRNVEGRGEDRRPQLSDLRQSGTIEEDARLVIFLFRGEYYYRPPDDPESETPDEALDRELKLAKVRNKLLWIVAKANGGPVGQVETFIDVGCGAIRDREAR